MAAQRPQSSVIVRLAIVLGPMLLGALLWLSEQDLGEGDDASPVVAEAAPPAVHRPAEPARQEAEREDAVPPPVSPQEPPAPSAAEPEPTLSSRFADASPASDLPPPVGWYASIAAVPVEPLLAALSEPPMMVLPPPAPSNSRQPLVKALTPEIAAVLTPPAAAPLPLRPPAASFARRTGDVADEMVEAPPGTSPFLTGDPNRLRMLMQQGAAGFPRGDDMEQAKGLRLVRVAAALGYYPARSLIVREFPHSRVLRLVIPAGDAVRYALDGYTGDPAAAGDPDAAFAPLVGYFAERQALSLFAGHLLDAIYDDTRLQDDERLRAILATLAKVPGGCADLVRLLALPAIWWTPGCPPALKHYVQSQAHARRSPGRDAASRRQALSQLQALAAAR